MQDKTSKFFNNSNDVLIYIANNKFEINNKAVNGREILLSDKIVSIFSDLAPTLKDEKDLIKIIRDKGALEVLKGAMNASASEQEVTIKRAAAKLPAFMDKDAINSMLNEFTFALGWQVNQ